MTNRYHLHQISHTACITCLLLLSGCSEEKFPQQEEETGITVHFASDGIPVTRDVTYEQFADGTVLGVFAYTCDADGNYTTPDLLYNASLTRVTSDNLTSYQCNPAAHWPSATGKVLFTAYHPHNSSVAAGTIIPSPQSSSGLPEITVELGKEKGKVDFAVATVGPITPTFDANNPNDIITRENYYVNFRFKRELSEIVFRAKTANINALTKLYINAISIKNVHKKGVFHVSMDKWELSNEDVDATTGATMQMATGGAPVPDDKYDYLMNPGNTSPRDASIVMIPQKYDNVEFEATYTLEYLKASGGCEYRIVGTKKIPLTINWEPGTIYVYDLEFGFYEAEDEKANFNFKVDAWKKENITTDIH
mgnify:FL=1